MIDYLSEWLERLYDWTSNYPMFWYLHLFLKNFYWSIVHLQCCVSFEVKMQVAQLSPTLCHSVVHSPWKSPVQNSGVGILSLLQGIFRTQGLNPGLLHCRQIPYHLSHQGSPRILEWVAYPFSNGSFPPRNWTRVPCIADRFFTSWTTKEAPLVSCVLQRESVIHIHISTLFKIFPHKPLQSTE